jgi:hypothetical protein
MAEYLPSTQPSPAARMAITVGTCTVAAAAATAAWGLWPALAAAAGAAAGCAAGLVLAFLWLERPFAASLERRLGAEAEAARAAACTSETRSRSIEATCAAAPIMARHVATARDQTREATESLTGSLSALVERLDARAAVDVEGEATAHYIRQRLAGAGARITRLAQGLPAGAGLEYADELTLSRALEGRREFS